MSRKEMYFVLIPDSGGRHDFSKTLAEHEAKAEKYGYR
jgi:cell division protein YceG involved in septum cleavage